MIRINKLPSTIKEIIITASILASGNLRGNLVVSISNASTLRSGRSVIFLMGVRDPM